MRYNSKGFTLLELIAIIILIGIVSTIAVPIVNKVLFNSKLETFKTTVYNLDKEVRNTCNEEDADDLDITTKYIINDGVITPTVDIDGKLPNGEIDVEQGCKTTFVLSNDEYVATKINSSGKVLFQSLNENKTKKTYVESDLNGATPKLDYEMIPVTITNDGLVKKANIYTPWYDYSGRLWANAVLVTNETRNKYKSSLSGVTIDNNDILAYFVWIPRYKYTFPEGSNERIIDIVFENKNTSKSSGSAMGNKFYTHPAFTYNGNELDGFWVGKFETTGTSELPTILPNTKSLRNQNINAQFASSSYFKSKYGLTDESRMLKNSEWGAIAYLSHSKYGIGTEVRYNNNLNYLTGCGADSDSSAASPLCMIQYGADYSYPQSTTGNIYGIFDMAGGSLEYVMGNYNNIISSSGFSSLPETKNYNLYTSNNYSTACSSNACKGDATYETKGWYNDYYKTLDSTISTWIHRGGYYGSTSNEGLFNISNSTGEASNNFTFRVVVLAK